MLNGRVALVTGAAGGLGLHMARRFQGAGAFGMALDRDAVELERVAPESWIARAADVRREGEVAAAFDGAVERFGRLDIVVANAGIVPPWRSTAEIDLAEWDDVCAVNIRGVAATLKHAARTVAPGGSIIVMGSLNSWRGHPGQALYAATKHAVIGIVRAAALDLGRAGIRVNALAPGPVATDALLDRMRLRAYSGGIPFETALQNAADAAALGRMATADEIASAALFLASDLSSGITGSILPIDAGHSL